MHVRPYAMAESVLIWAAVRTDRGIMAAPASCGRGHCTRVYSSFPN